MPKPNALDTVVKVDPVAQPILGKQLKRKEIMGKLWDHIRAKGLKDPNDGRIVNVQKDPEMKAIFGNKPVHMTGLMGPINKHVKGPDKK